MTLTYGCMARSRLRGYFATMLSDPKSTAGKGRATIDEQRNFLIELILSFYTICSDAIEGRYFHDFFQNDKDSEKLLRANLMNLHVE